VRTNLLGALAAQVAVAVLTASVRPYTTLAFGTLVPVYGLGLCGLWAARHGSFGSRVVARRAGPIGHDAAEAAGPDETRAAPGE
jgi:hypothetical protein